MRGTGRLTALVAVTAVVVGGHTAAAHAATLGYDDEGDIVYAAAPGEANDLRVEKGVDAFTFTDPGAVITAVAPDCIAVTPTTARCTPRQRFAQLVELRLGDGDDRAVSLRAPQTLEGSVLPYTGLHVHAGDGHDVVETDDFAILHGDPGDDRLLGTSLASAHGDAGDDLVRGCLANGGDGDDTMDVRGFDCHAIPGPGADTFVATSASRAHLSYAGETAPVSITLDGRRNDRPDGQDDVGPGFATIVGGAAADRLEGGPGADGLFGGGGDDVLLGHGGDDALGGGAGDDVASGGPGADRVGGNTAGRDVLDGGPGANRIGGGGTGAIDVASYADRTAPVRVTAEPWDFLAPSAGDDGEAGEGDTVLGAEEVLGGAGADVLVGSREGEALIGGDGDDALQGGDGADRLDGGAGADGLQGGAGDDELHTRDKTRDVVGCGDGADAGTADGRDDVARDCEAVRFGGPAPA